MVGPNVLDLTHVNGSLETETLDSSQWNAVDDEAEWSTRCLLNSGPLVARSKRDEFPKKLCAHNVHCLLQLEGHCISRISFFFWSLTIWDVVTTSLNAYLQSVGKYAVGNPSRNGGWKISCLNMGGLCSVCVDLHDIGRRYCWDFQIAFRHCI